MSALELVGLLRRQGIRDPEVLDAIASVPRDLFVPGHLASHAWDNVALPIGAGQTISQPWIVARMTELARLAPGDKVLEIGTGSGYQTAVLCTLDVDVYTVERLSEHAAAARERLASLGHAPRARVGDGWLGWPEAAPFDRILVTAAPETVPPALLDQLAEGGRLVIPVGPEQRQVLTVIQRKDGGVEEQAVVPVSFVPLVRGGETASGEQGLATE